MDPEKKPDADASRPPPRKMRFGPKPINRDQKPVVVVPKVEKVEDEIDAAQAEELMRRFREASAFKPKKERDVKPVKLEFGVRPGAAPPPSSIRSCSSSASYSFGVEEKKVKKGYTEPWDYESEYPVTLPWRKPYSGNPEILDKEEFGEDSEKPLADNEKDLNPAEVLGLQDPNLENELFFFQLPKVFPIPKQSPGEDKKQQDSPLAKLGEGLMGKMLIYKSGAIKLKIGDILHEVSPGVNCGFSQKAVAINFKRRDCTNLGEINSRAVVTPDVDSLVSSLCDL